MSELYYCNVCNKLFSEALVAAVAKPDNMVHMQVEAHESLVAELGQACYAKSFVCANCCNAIVKGEKIPAPKGHYEWPRLEVVDAKGCSEYGLKKEAFMHSFEGMLHVPSADLPENIQSKIRESYALMDSSLKEKIAEIFEGDIFQLDQYVSTMEMVYSHLFEQLRELNELREAEEKERDDDESEPQALSFIDPSDDNQENKEL